MRLKSLEVVGFKSFADRTIVNFEEGVTGVVGPNGCGKSNVVDAIRWVMGEQSAKHLRGNNMGDVIFNGTETRAAMGMASVFLTFDNSDGRAPAEYADYSEITIGRRLYRSGESEYFINKTSCRLKDITDFFLGTGIGTRAYAIVEQGMIGSILGAKPEERRMLIEEAAGISKFKARKEAAVRKMDSTKMNLSRLTDIIGELERQINSLYRQAKKAERFQKFSDELKGLEVMVTAHQYSILRSGIDELKTKIDLIKESEVSGGSLLSKEEADIEFQKIRLSELEQKLDEVQEELYARQNEFQLAEADISYKTKTIDQLTLQSEKDKAEILEFLNRLDTLRNDLDRINAEKVDSDVCALSAEEELSGIETELSDLRDTHHETVVSLEDARRRVFETVGSVSETATRVEQMRNKEIELQDRVLKDQREIDIIDPKLKDIEEKIGVRTGETAGTKQLKLELDGSSAAAYETLKMQSEELQKAEVKVSFLKEELGKKRSRLFSLEELNKNFEGYKEGVKSVLKRREVENMYDGVMGTISDIVETKPEYETALGAVLGEKLQYVVVKSQAVGVEAVDYLKTQAVGRSTFIPVEVGTESEYGAMPQGEGVVGRLIDHVNYADDHKCIVNYLLKDVVLVEDLKKGLNMTGANGFCGTMVTLDGDVIDPVGIITGGAGGDATGQLLAHRREIKELSESVASMSSELAIEDHELAKLRDRVDGIKKSIEEIERESRKKELNLVEQQQDLNHLNLDAEHHRNMRDKLSIEIAALTEELAKIRTDLALMEQKLEESTNARAGLEKAVEEQQTKETELRTKLQEIMQKRTELGLVKKNELERVEGLERDIARIVGEISDAVVGLAERRLEIAESYNVIKTYTFSTDCKRRQMAYLMTAIEEMRTHQTEIKEQYDADMHIVREKEASIRNIRKKHEEQVQNLHNMEIEFTQKNEKISYMNKEIFERYKVDLATTYANYLDTQIDVDASAAHVADLKDKIDKIGSVNVDAIHEYDDLKVRYDFLKAQYDDLTRSLDDLQKAITKINKTSRQRFQETFESVNERFQKLFPKLFEGGKASLLLTDDQNILESGVDIVAQPPGKKLQSISLLSGGEKALTAVALIFSLFLHRPSPFCLLDEVDAPLDDANIDRFNDIIREMTKLSQFILITHNKRTMELADTLYGVTMEEKGASKIISIALSNKKVSEVTAA